MPSRLMKTREDIRSTSIRSESITLDAVPRAALARSGDEDTTIAANNAPPLPVVLSFDVEEHHRIEAAAGLQVDPGLQRIYGERMSQATVWTLEQLAARGIRATFFVVGQIALTDPKLVRLICEAGHEVASHGWDHRRIHVMSPESFKEDIRNQQGRTGAGLWDGRCRLPCTDIQCGAPDCVGPGYSRGSGNGL